MRIVVQLLENYLSQEIPCIVLTTDTSKYFFNVPPSFQRFIRLHKTKFPSIGYFFFTKSCATTISGLSGLLMTLFEKSQTNCKLYLQKEMFDYFEQLKWKVGSKMLRYSYCDWTGRNRMGLLDRDVIRKLCQTNFINEVIHDPNAFVLKKPLEQQNNSVQYLTKVPSFQNHEMQIIPFSIVSKGEHLTNYILILPPTPGGFNQKKIKQLGITPLKMPQLIKDGKVQVNERIIHIDQVREKEVPGSNVVILHANGEESLEKAILHPTFLNYIKNKQNHTHTVIHILEQKQIAASAEFKQILGLFPQPTEHILFNRSFRNQDETKGDFFSFPPHVEIVSAISALFPGSMPNISAIHQNYIDNFYKNCQITQKMFQGTRINSYRKLWETILVPSRGKGYQLLNPAKMSSQKKEKALQIEQYNVEQLKLELKEGQLEKQVNFNKFNPKIVFLGTGSMMPNKYRNVSSIFLEIDESNSILLDCGQGSFYQLNNHYGPDKIADVLLSVRIIFITHIHADHNLGILDMISERIKLAKKHGRKDKVYLIIPSNMMSWLTGYMKYVEDLREGCQVLFIQTILGKEVKAGIGNMSKDNNCSTQDKDLKEQGQQNQQKMKQQSTQSKEQVSFPKNSKQTKMIDQSQEKDQQYKEQVDFYYFPNEQQILDKEMITQPNALVGFKEYLSAMDVHQFLPVGVIHCPQSYGVIIEHKSGVKISYSGDSRPTKQFRVAAQNSTLLIHQATFGDDLLVQAKEKKHSTVGQAIQIGIKSGSWKTALTHFSQRYKSAADIVNPSLYKSDKLKEKYARNHTITCFDHLQMRMSDLATMPYYSRAISRLIPKQSNQ